MSKEYVDRHDRPLRDGADEPRCPNLGSACNCSGACLPSGYAMGTLTQDYWQYNGECR